MPSPRLDYGHLAQKLILELGPLFTFFGVAQWGGIFAGTAAFMAATALAALASWWRERRLPVLPLIGTACAAVFGGLTLWLDDPAFIMVRPTLYNLAAAAVLLAGMIRGRLLLRHAFGERMGLSEDAWKAVTWRVVLFLMALSLLNEVVWRNWPAEDWIAFKAFMVPVMNLTFIAYLLLFVRRVEGSEELAE